VLFETRQQVLQVQLRTKPLLQTLERAFDPMSSNKDCTIVYMLPESPKSGIATAAAGAAAVDEDPPCASEPLRPKWQCHDLHASK
jgi:hypothetical protein